ncbi:hypothetical protein HDE69_005079 [Pedobacter cryoconitis]|uniref:Uncharacterized protein n=1 Tax=Pedobacter cryoconitis TaxID=188932 RepID=A0A7W8YY51_9SPHI|nr:hypothetical protein [Pedobacter cryoconitis]
MKAGLSNLPDKAISIKKGGHPFFGKRRFKFKPALSFIDKYALMQCKRGPERKIKGYVFDFIKGN